MSRGKEYLTEDAGGRLKEIMAELNLSGIQLAQTCGYTSSHIYGITTGKYRLLRNVAEKVAIAYGINMAWLETGEGEMFITKDSFNEESETPAQRLRKVYEESGLTQREFCKRLSSSTATLSELLTEKRKINPHYAKRIEDTFGIGMDWLLYGKEKSKNYPCSDKMIAFLKENPDKREIVWMWMQENGAQI